MKKLLIMGLAFVAMLVVLVACDDADAPNGGSGNGETPNVDTNGGNGEISGTLRVMSFMDDPLALATYFTELHPDVEIDFIMTGMSEGAYQQQLQLILAGGTDVPDIVMLDAQFVRQFVESPFLADLSDMSSILEDLDIFPFTIDAGTDDDGIIRAISHQAAPGVMYYRRSLAERYFGTDDPEVIQTYFQDMDAFLASAKQIREISDGATFTISSHIELSNLFFANRQTPWVVDDQLMIDPILHQYLDIASAMRTHGLEAEIGTWGPEWYASFSDTLVDAHGNDRQIFAYFLPTWGLNHPLMDSAGDTAGDWALIPGPLPYQWGGAWFAIPNGAGNPEAARAFLEFVFTDDLLTKWATGYFTNERLRAIDDSLPTTLQIPAGDFVSSDRVVQAVAPQIVGTPTYYFVGGQNPHDIFAQVSSYVSLENIQSTDFIMNAAWTEAVTQYISGELTREAAIQSFIDSILIDIPNLQVP